MSVIDTLEGEELRELVRTFAKNWLAHDGLWFQAVESARGLDEAIERDKEAWARFAPIEAGRIRRLAGLGEQPGLEGLARALEYRLYAAINTQTIQMQEGVLRFYMNTCRVQSARKRKGLPDFPCKPVGIVEFSAFASTIDPRILTRPIACPPDPHPGTWMCGWEFSLEAP
jgi:hypothetical protein